MTVWFFFTVFVVFFGLFACMAALVMLVLHFVTDDIRARSHIALSFTVGVGALLTALVVGEKLITGNSIGPWETPLVAEDKVTAGIFLTSLVSLGGATISQARSAFNNAAITYVQKLGREAERKMYLDTR